MKTLRVPASSANLGPGFDALGMALDIHLECSFEPATELRIEVAGRDAHRIPANATNLIWQTALSLTPLPPVHLAVHNAIPLGKGLGSSAAAITAGVVIANELGGMGWDRARILDETSRMEGHPDNAAACALGGIVASALDDEGRTIAVRMELPAGIEIAIVVPDFALPTSEARAVLPDCYSRADAVFNVQRTALLVAALAKGDRRALSTALADRLHQPQRSKLVPGLSPILDLRAPGLLGCTLSGAGPSVLVFFEAGSSDCCQLVHQVFEAHGQRCEVLHTRVAEGFELA